MDIASLNLLIPFTGGILVTVIGSFATYLIQSKQFKRNQAWEREKMEENQKQQEKQRKYETYNKILRLDGENIIVEHIPHMDDRKFEYSTYRDTVRPALFENFHLLDQVVSDWVITIDEIIERCNVYEEISEEDHNSLAHYYIHIIDFIKDYYKEMRLHQK